MYELLKDFLTTPKPFSRYTVKDLWTRDHLSQQMLKFHLDSNSDLASRPVQTIEQAVDWIDSKLQLRGKRLCDLGCGPGLYAHQFAERGARVTGIDFSNSSIGYAKSSAQSQDQPIDYIVADYLVDPLPEGFDIVTLIFCDYCVLSPEQRRLLLARIREMLSPRGYLVFDVVSERAYGEKQEELLFEQQLMNGFWSAQEYIGFKKSTKYADLLVSLDRYLIIEPGESWEIFNWMQYFSPEAISAELREAGFQTRELRNSFSDQPYDANSETIGLITQI